MEDKKIRALLDKVLTDLGALHKSFNNPIPNSIHVMNAESEISNIIEYVKEATGE